MKKLIYLAVLALLVSLSCEIALAETVTEDAKSIVTVQSAAPSITKVRDQQWGTLQVGNSRTLDPTSGLENARFDITGEGTIDTPGSVTLTGPGDPITATLTTDTVDDSDDYVTKRRHYVGGTITIPAGQEAGSYEGTITISVVYE